jgi:hypothetical protein
MLNNNYRLKEIIKNVDSFDLGKNLIILNIDKKILLYEEDRFSKILFQLNSNCHFKLVNEKIVISDNSKEIENYVLSSETGEIIVDLNHLDSSFVNLEGNSKIKTIKLKNKNLNIYDFEAFKTVLEIEREYSIINFISNNNIYLNPRRSQLITKFDFLLNTFIWQTDLSSYGTIRKVSGVCGEELIVLMENDLFVFLSVETGTISSTLSPFEDLKDVNGFAIKGFYDFYLDENKGVISLLNKCFYYEIDVKTKEVKQLKSFYTGNAYGLGRLPNMPEPPTDLIVTKSYYTEDFIYFFGAKGFSSNIIGVFNRKSFEIEWQFTLNIHETNKYNNLKDIQYSNGKIYVLDTDGNLYIFEKFD